MAGAKNEAKVKFTADTSEYTEALQEAGNEMSNLRADMKLVEAQFKNTGDEAEYHRQKLSILQQELQVNEEKQMALNAKLDVARQIYGEGSEEVMKLERSLTYAKVEEQNLLNQLNETNGGLEQQEQAAEEAGSSVDDMANVIVSAGIADKIREIGEAAMDMAGEFSEASATVVEGTGASGEALDVLNEAARNAFGQIRNSSADLNSVSSVLAELNTRFGITGEDAEKLTVDISNFAQHVGIDGTSAVDQMANVMKRWGMDISDAESLMDDLTTANQACQMSVDDMTGYLVNNSTQFQELGYSTEEALAMLISLSDGGANVGTVMSGLTKGIANMSAETDDVPGAFQAAVEAISECGSVSEALQTEVGNTGKTVEQIFGKKAAQELATNIQNGSFAIDGWTTALQDNEGAMQATTENATTMQDALSQATNNVSLALGATFAPAISAVAIQAAGVISQIAQVVQDSPVLQAIIVGVAVALGILAAALAISSIIQAVTTAWGMLNTVMLSNPIFLVVTAIAALVAALIYAYNNCEEFRAIVDAAFQAVKNVAINVFTSIKTTVGNAFSTISSLASSLQSTLSGAWNGIKSTATSVWNGIKTAMTNPIQSAKSTISGIINGIKNFFPLRIGRIIDNIKLPHFSISGEFSINPPSVPHFDIDWYAKGAVFNVASIIPTIYGLKGVGEAEPEAVSPISVLQTYVGAAVQRYAPQIDYDLLGDKVAGACAKLGISIEVDKRQLGRVVREVVE